LAGVSLHGAGIFALSERVVLVVSPTIPTVLTELRRWATRAESDSDRLLLWRFQETRDEAALLTLLGRHGPMVFGVCRRLLRDRNEAEDAFQATFLVLLRQADSLRRLESVGGWLHGVAYRLSQRIKADEARRRGRERLVPERRADDPFAPLDWKDLRSVLDEELNRLPEKYRVPLVLCHIEDRPLVEAARQLGWKLGTLAGRLARGRNLLRIRLVRRGVTLVAAAGVTSLAGPSLLAAVSLTLLASTVRIAVLVSGAAGASNLSASLTPLVNGMVQTMFLRKMRIAVGVLLACTCLALGAGSAARQALLAPAPGDPGQVAEARPGRTNDRVDATGAPLPEEAVARLGSTRLKHGESYITNMLFTNDGKTLLSQSYGQLLAWDVNTGQLVRQFPKEAEPGNWHGAALAPDGKTLATPGDKGARLWDVATAKEIRTIGAARFVWVQFSPDGTRLVSLGGGRFVECNLWDARTGENLCAWKVADGEDFATPPVFTKDGKSLITAHRDNAVRFWNVETGEECKKIVLNWQSPRRLVLSPDGKTVAATAFQSGHIHFLDVAEGKERLRITAPDRTDAYGRKIGFNEIAFTPDGKALIAASLDDSLIFLDPATGKEQRRLEKGFANVFCMVVSQDGKTIASAVGGKSIRLTDAASGRDLVESAGHKGGVWSVTFADGDKLVASVGGGKEVFVWDAVTGRELRRLKGHTEEVTSVGLSPDGLLVSTSADKTVRFWDPIAGKQVRQIKSLTNGWDHARSPDGKLVVTMDGKSPPDLSTLRLVEVATGKELWNQQTGHHWFGSTFTRDGKTLVAWSGDQTIHLLDAKTGQERKQYLVDGGGLGVNNKAYLSYSIRLSNDGKLLACGRQRNTLVVVETATGKVLFHLKGLPDGVSAIAFSPDDRMLAWGGWRDPTIHLLEVATGKERHHYAGTIGRVLTLAFSPDGKKLLSGSDDTTVTVWDVTGRLREASLGRPLSATQLETVWKTLCEEDAGNSFRAIQTLAGSPKETVSYLRKLVKPAPRAPEKDIARWIADLDSEDFETRERANQNLDKLGEGAFAAYDKALAANASLEMRRRLELLKEKHDPLRAPSAERLRVLRALEVLGICGTEARELLTTLSQGAPGASVTEAARSALQRLARQR
jgi:RNA polymerase sigma factor (sigma-70 family)